MNPKVDQFVNQAKQWQAELAKLRSIILKTRLEEDFKWRLPCYSYNGGNVIIVQPFKKCLAVMFFKGSLLKDPKKVLVNNGPNSMAARRLEFTSVQEITKAAPLIKAYLQEAIRIEESGKKVNFKARTQLLPQELKAVFAKQPKLKQAFYSLTPGRQRGYLLHFAGAKQPATRQSRVEKYIPRILAGKGMHD